MFRLAFGTFASATSAALLATWFATAFPAQGEEPLWRLPLSRQLDGSQAFDRSFFHEPPALYWPAYFWLWNAALEPNLLKEQLGQMASCGARSVCMLPMPKEFRPSNTNNSMDPGYLTDGFFDRVALAVAESRRLKMHWWLYDEGGWPSGQACGQVIAGHPELASQVVVREPITLRAQQPYVVPTGAIALVVHEGDRRILIEPGATWLKDKAPDRAWLYRAQRRGGVDLLSPKTTQRFIELTHRRYAAKLATLPERPPVYFTFTDEPAVPAMAPGSQIPWTDGAGEAFKSRFGYDLREHLDELFSEPAAGASGWPCRARVDYFDFWTRRFCEAFFEPLRSAAQEMGMLSGGHLGGEDETLGALRHGFGHILRTLRAMDVPGVDVIWRQLFPGQEPRHHFPRFASSAAHQIGRRLTFTESVAVYGSGVTPEQVRWVLDYQFVRGIQLVVLCGFPLSTHDHHMTGERPHYGPTNPLWSILPDFHAGIARTSYALSCGEPRVDAALYYPARDLWAFGMKDVTAAGDHDRLARRMSEQQREFDILDDDILETWPAADGYLVGSAVRYRTLAFGRTRWLGRPAAEKLVQWLKGPGLLLAVDHLPGVDGDGGEALAQRLGCPNRPGRHAVQGGKGFVLIGSIDEIVSAMCPLLVCDPPNVDLRVTARDLPGGSAVYFVFNEGLTPYKGRLTVPERGRIERFYPYTGRSEPLATSAAPDGRRTTELSLEGTESALILATGGEPTSTPPPVPIDAWRDIADGWGLKPLRRFCVGEHDFEIRPSSAAAISLERLGSWAPQLTADFSGHAEYRKTVTIAPDEANRPLTLDLGRVEYACEVYLDKQRVGSLFGRPWRIELPSVSAGAHELRIIVSNTLANELTSERVRQEWSKKKGPGWPSPYHERAIRFEVDSRGGGLLGPVRLGRRP